MSRFPRQWKVGMLCILLLCSAEARRLHINTYQLQAKHRVGRNSTLANTTDQLVVEKQKVIEQLAALGALLCVLAVVNTANAVVTAHRLKAAIHTSTELQSVQSSIFHQRTTQCVQFRRTRLQVALMHAQMANFVTIAAGSHIDTPQWAAAAQTISSTVKDVQNVVEEHVRFTCYSIDEGEVQLATNIATVKERVSELQGKMYRDTLQVLMSLMTVAEAVKIDAQVQQKESSLDPSNNEIFSKLPKQVQADFMSKYDAAVKDAESGVLWAEVSFVTQIEGAKSAGVSSTGCTIMFTMHSIITALVMANVAVNIPPVVGLIGSYISFVASGVGLIKQLREGGASYSDLAVAELQLLQNCLVCVQTTITYFGGALLPGVVHTIAIISIITSTIRTTQNMYVAAAERKEHAVMIEQAQDVLARFRISHAYKSCQMLSVAEHWAELQEMVIRAIPLDELDVSGEEAEGIVQQALGSNLDQLCQFSPRFCYSLLLDGQMPKMVRDAFGEGRMNQLREKVEHGPLSDLAAYENKDQKIMLESMGFYLVYPGLMACRGCTNEVIIDMAMILDGVPPAKSRCCCTTASRRCLIIPHAHLNWASRCPPIEIYNKHLQLHQQEACGEDMLQRKVSIQDLQARLSQYPQDTSLNFINLPDQRFLGFYKLRDAQTAILDFEHHLVELTAPHSYFELHTHMADVLADNNWQLLAYLSHAPESKQRPFFSGLIARKGPVKHPDEQIAASTLRLYTGVAITTGACRLNEYWRTHARYLWSRDHTMYPPLSTPLAAHVWAFESGFDLAKARPNERLRFLREHANAPLSFAWAECLVLDQRPLMRASDTVKVVPVHEITRGFHWPGEGIAGSYDGRYIDGAGTHYCCCSEVDDTQCDWSSAGSFFSSCPKLTDSDGTPFHLVRSDDAKCTHDSAWVEDWKKLSDGVQRLYGKGWMIETDYLSLLLRHPGNDRVVDRQFAIVTWPVDNNVTGPLAMSHFAPTQTLVQFVHDLGISFQIFKELPEAIAEGGWWPDLLASRSCNSSAQLCFEKADVLMMSRKILWDVQNFRAQTLIDLDNEMCSFADQSLDEALLALGVMQPSHPTPLPAVGDSVLLTKLSPINEGRLFNRGHCADRAAESFLMGSVEMNPLGDMEEDATPINLSAPFQEFASQHNAVAHVYDTAVETWASLSHEILTAGKDKLHEIAQDIAGSDCAFQATWHLQPERTSCPCTSTLDGLGQGRVGVSVENGVPKESCLQYTEPLAVDSYLVQWSGGVTEDFGFSGAALREHGFIELHRRTTSLKLQSRYDYWVTEKVWVRYDPRVQSANHDKASIKEALRSLQSEGLQFTPTGNLLPYRSWSLS